MKVTTRFVHQGERTKLIDVTVAYEGTIAVVPPDPDDFVQCWRLEGYLDPFTTLPSVVLVDAEDATVYFTDFKPVPKALAQIALAIVRAAKGPHLVKA